MTPLEHPDLSTEIEHLRSTLAVLEARIEELGTLEPHGASAHETDSLIRRLRKVYDNLKLARPQVYFGRLDFELAEPPAGEPAQETHYLGRIGFDQNGKIIVVDWRAPVARLFSRRRPGPVHYLSPDGVVNVQLQLKRHFHIRAEHLLNFQDEFDTRPATEAAPEARASLVDPDAFLRDILSGRREAQLGDIVATIQEHQDDLIRADPQQVLVVQGVAGSGKTSIALHRVAFLLYPGNKTGIEAGRCIIFGPNQLFLDYIANVLPGLGVTDIAQMTLDSWALARLGLADRRLTDQTLETLLDAQQPEQEKRAVTLRSQLKVSLRMGRLLENLVEGWRARLNIPAAGFVYAGLGPLKVTVTVTARRAAEIYHSLIELPLHHHRRRFQEMVLGELMGDYATATLRQIEQQHDEGEDLQDRARQLLVEADRLDQYAVLARQDGDAELEAAQAAAHLAQGAQGLRALADHFQRRGEGLRLRAARLKDEEGQGRSRGAVRAKVQKALEAELETAWPNLEPLTAYAEMFANPGQLARLGRSVFSAEELARLSATRLVDDTTLDISDLPALCYLHTLVQGVATPLYDHVVVDEAQDVAPLYYAVLRRFSRNGSFTILGDVAQGLHAYRGLSEWEEVRQVFAGRPYAYHDIRDSYRSTHEVITFANLLLELVTPATHTPLLARPFERHGVPVQLQRCGGRPALGAELAQAIARLRADGYDNIAVIGKTPTHCAALAALLREAGLGENDFQVVTPEAHYAGGLVVLPVYLAKGMEFEAVLVADADEQTYAGTEFDGRLLYVAATRALHVLHLYATGPFNSHLELAASALASST